MIDNNTIFKGVIRDIDSRGYSNFVTDIMFRIINFSDLYFFAEEISTGCIFPIYSMFHQQDDEPSNCNSFGFNCHESYLKNGRYYVHFPIKMKPEVLFKYSFDESKLGRKNEITYASIDEVNRYLSCKYVSRMWKRDLQKMEAANLYMCDLELIKQQIVQLKDGVRDFSFDLSQSYPKYERYFSPIKLNNISDMGYDLSTQYDLCNLIGREEEIKKIVKTVAIKGKSVILLGEPGAGKTSIVEKLALDIRNGESKFLDKKVIFAVNCAALVAGTKYRGEFETKFKELIEFCKNNKGQIILFIDEIHMLYGLGAAEGAVDAMNILKPYISNGDVTVIGATTKMEYEKQMTKDPAFLRRFENVEVSTPSKEMTIAILLSYIKELELKYGIKLSLNDNARQSFAERIFEITDGKCAYITGNVKIENPTLSKNIIENAFAEVVYSGRKMVTADDINMSIEEHDKLSLEFMSEFGYDLSTQDKLCNLVGRNKEQERIIKAIAIEGNSVLLVGEPGTGKTSIVEKLALDIKNGHCEFLKDKTIFYVNAASLCSGTKYRGEFEEKINKLLNCCRKNKGKIILFIDEIHMLYGLGRSTETTIDAMNILKPYISNGDLTIIGATTKMEFEKYMSNDPAFLRRFEQVEVTPLDEETKIQILISYANDLEKRYNIKVDFDGISIYQLMRYVVKITDLKFQTVKGDVKVENPTISKRLLDNAFSDAIYHKKDTVTIEDMCFAILDCDKLSIEFRKDCAEKLREYINNDGKSCEINTPTLVRGTSVGFTY